MILSQTKLPTGSGSARPPDYPSYINLADWVNHTNVRTDDGEEAVATHDASAYVPSDWITTSEELLCYGFNFTIPDYACIEKIVVRIKKRSSYVMYFPNLGYTTTTNVNRIRDASVRLLKYGSVTGTNLAKGLGELISNPIVLWPNVNSEDFYYGDDSTVDNLWGSNWSPSDINDIGFGVSISSTTATGSRDWRGGSIVDVVEATVYYTEYYSPLGGLTSAGMSIVDPEIAIGGSTIGAINNQEGLVYSHTVSGSMLMGGHSPPTYDVDGSGAVQINGIADNLFIGESVFEGGISWSGEADITLLDIIEVGGSVSIGGYSTAHNFYEPLGGAGINGESVSESSYIALGGIIGDGEIDITVNVNEPRGEVSGVLSGGISDKTSTKNFHFEGGSSELGEDGIDEESRPGVVLGTATSYGISNVALNASGGVYVSNVLSPLVAYACFYKETSLLWNTIGLVTRDVDFLWNTGQLTMYWYRIIGEGRQGDECDLVADPCCQKFVVNVHARTVAELCEKLSDRHWTLPIQSIQKFSRPAATEDAKEYIELYGECNELEPIEFCDIPQCADYCVDCDVRVTFNFTMNQSVDAFYDYQFGDGTVNERSVFLGGLGDYLLDLHLPDYHYNPIDPIVELGSEFLCYPDYHIASGGIDVKGQADVGFPRHEFVGGEWPYVTDFVAAKEATSSSSDSSGLIPWNYSYRALLADGLNAEVTISYGETSEYLIFNNFDFQLPTDVNILGFKVYVHRWTTQVAVRDLSIVLVDGDQIVSNNLARSFTWPLIPTTAWYGSDGLDGGDGFEPLVDTDWSPSFFNSEDFGVAIQVEEYGNNPGTWAYVDYVSVQVIYESSANQIVRVGSTTEVRSEHWSHDSSGSLEIGGDGLPYRVDRRYRPTGIGEGQPTSFKISGTHTIKLYYEVEDLNYVWRDSTVDDGDFYDGTSAIEGLSGTSQQRSDFLASAVGSAAEWQQTSKGVKSDGNYTYCNLSVDSSSEFFVVRGFEWGPSELESNMAIRGVKVYITNRFATKPEVYDDQIYLVRGNSILSYNFAKSDVWTAIPTVAIYGSNGFDEEDQIRDTELNPWDVDDFSDSEFGVAIALRNADSSSGTYAKIDGVIVQLTIDYAGREQVYESHINLIGGATVDSDYREGNGVAVLGGFAEVKPFWIIMDGGVICNGDGAFFDEWVYEPVDGTSDGTDDIWHIRISGEASAYEANHSNIANGGAVMGGSPLISSNRFDFTSDGIGVFALGGESYSGTDLESGFISIVGSMEVLDFGGIYAEVSDDSTIGQLIDPVASCGCLAIPLTISVRHNIDVRNILSQFLVRNNLYLPNDIKLYYNRPNNSWQHNAHYTGYSADANTNQKWDLVFEVQCSDEMGGVNIGRKIWKTSVSIFRKNLTTGEDYDTRIIFALLPDAICDTNSNELDFSVIYNTQLGSALIKPENAIIYQVSVYDNIGLFKNQYWVNNPNIVINVSQSGFPLTGTRYDIYDLVVQPDQAVPVPSS